LNNTLYRCGNCLLDTANRRFSRDGDDIVLEPKVFAVLVQLVSRPGQLLRREQLLDAVWGHRYVTASTLSRVIALARRALLDDAGEPNFIQTVHGSGYRYVGPVEQGAPLAETSLARFGPPPTAHLPARIQSLLGREHELAQLDALLTDARSLTIVGTGGMGKTQCALAFAHSQVGNYSDGVWFFDLAPLESAEEWLQALSYALAIAPADKPSLLPRIAQALADRRALFVLDNCDRLSAQLGSLVVEVLRATRQLKILATSRHPLNFIGERLLCMPPLRLPGIRNPASETELNEVASAPAVGLLLARVRDAQPEFALHTANAPAVVDICERLDGMPLALELAAARFMMLSPEQVLERLDQRFRFLVSDSAGRDHRHRNLVALMDWSYRLLSPREQRYLAWLGVFVQGWTVEAAIDLASAFDTSPEEAVDLLTGLANKSLVSVDQSVSPPRYRLLESVREFALEQLAASGDERRARDAHLVHTIRMAAAARADMVGGRMQERVGLLTREQGNLISACDYAVTAGGDPAAALRINGSLALFFKAHGNNLLGKRLIDQALAKNPPVRTKERGQALLCRGLIGLYGEKATPDKALLEAADIAREVDDEWTAAYASGQYAMWLLHAGRKAEIAEHLGTVERSAAMLDDDILRGLAGLIRGWAYLAAGATQDSISILQSVRELGGDFHQHHFIDMYLGLGLFRIGNHAAAAAQWHAAMRNALGLGHRRGVAGSIEGCGYIAERMGRADAACRLLSAAEQIRRRSGSPLFSFWIPHNAAANRELRRTLGNADYEAAFSAGVHWREEDATNQASALLREFAANS
jgi:predicted ATPase/DNA-binding winged helix-turn-helix (wHTH) protein